jgi:hypothetical protein
MQYFTIIVMISNFHGNYKPKLYNLCSKSAEFDYMFIYLYVKNFLLKNIPSRHSKEKTET